jgi:hypothetical protein
LTIKLSYRYYTKLYHKENPKRIKETDQVVPEFYWLEFRHCQDYTPIKCAGCAPPYCHVRTASYKVPGSGNLLREQLQHPNITYYQRNRMNSTASQTSAHSIDLYDQDHYSIPDDELSSAGSSTISSAEDATSTSMDMDASSSQTSSKKALTVTKKPKLKTSSSERVVDPHVTGPPSLHGQSIATVTTTSQQVADDAQSDTTTSSYKRRVPLTTLATAEDFTFGASKSQTQKQDDSKPKETPPASISSLKFRARDVPSSKSITEIRETSAVHVAGKSFNHGKIISTKILPDVTSSPETSPTTFFTYRAQLTFGLPS